MAVIPGAFRLLFVLNLEIVVAKSNRNNDHFMAFFSSSYIQPPRTRTPRMTSKNKGR